MKAEAYQTTKQGRRVRVVSTGGLDYTSDNAPDLLTAIIQSKKPETIAVVWDTATFWKPIFTLLPASETALLADGKAGRIPGFRLWWGITRHARVIGIRGTFREHIKGNFYTESREEIEICELKQYYELDPAQKTGQGAELGNQVIATMEGMGLYPTSLVSAIAVYKESVLDKLPIPTMLDMPEETLDCHELAWNACDEWSASYKSWDGQTPAFSYDLTNAYGSALADLPNLKYAEIVRSPEIPPPGFAWGVMRGIIHNKTLVSPLVRPETGRPYVGYWKGVMSTDLYACLVHWGIADMEIQDGWYIYLKKIAKPFDYSMRRLYNFRSGTDILQNNLAKAMSVATWGKMLETRETKEGTEYGNLFNAIYGAMVVNAIETRVTDFIYSNGLQDDLISVTVDGLTTTKDLDISTERKFGEWRKQSVILDNEREGL